MPNYTLYGMIVVATVAAMALLVQCVGPNEAQAKCERNASYDTCFYALNR